NGKRGERAGQRAIAVSARGLANGRHTHASCRAAGSGAPVQGFGGRRCRRGEGMIHRFFLACSRRTYKYNTHPPLTSDMCNEAYVVLFAMSCKIAESVL